MLSGQVEHRVCNDIPEEVNQYQPRNFLTHAISLAATKSGDGLADSKLVLAWLLGAIGAPMMIVGLLVPVREALSLLPQLFIADRVRVLSKRKWAWVAGSAAQGLCVLAMAVVGTTLDGPAGGWTILSLLAVFALARSICSVSYKDVLGKTVSKRTRGAATGTAGTIAATVVLIFGVALSIGIVPLTITSICLALAVAGALWIGAACLFATIAEPPGATEGGANGQHRSLAQVGLLARDPQLVRFIVVRALLISTAIAPPFLLALAGAQSSSNLGELGLYVISASTASIASTYVWGRFADRSSRIVLVLAAAIAAAVLVSAGALSLAAASPELVHGAMPLLFFILMIAYQGVRLGRSTHIVDMTDPERRAAYTALSNTIIGILLLASGGFGLLVEVAGTEALMVLFAIMCLTASIIALGLEEVQKA